MLSPVGCFASLVVLSGNRFGRLPKGTIEQWNKTPGYLVDIGDYTN